MTIRRVLRWRLDTLDRDLQAVRDAGCDPGDIAGLLNRYDEWVQRVALNRLRRYSRARPLYDVDDVAQLVRITMWRALLDYRYSCPDEACARLVRKRKERKPGRPRRPDWSCETLAEWQRHCERHHRGEQHYPRTDVGRYVRVNVRLRTNMKLAASYSRKRTRPETEDRVALGSLATQAAEKGWRVREESVPVDGRPDIGVMVKELSEEAEHVLHPMAVRIVAWLAQGYTEREALELEDDEGSRRRRSKNERRARKRYRRLLARSRKQAHNFFALALERLTYEVGEEPTHTRRQRS